MVGAEDLPLVLAHVTRSIPDVSRMLLDASLDAVNRDAERPARMVAEFAKVSQILDEIESLVDANRSMLPDQAAMTLDMKLFDPHQRVERLV